MSPEQFKGQCDNRSDLYALGCIMYEVLTGRPAFSAKCAMDYLHEHFTKKPARVSAVNAELKLPKGLEEIVFKCLEKSPDKRYKSSKLCREALKSLRDRIKPNYVNAKPSTKMRIFSRESVVYSAVIIILAGMHILNSAQARPGAAAVSNTTAATPVVSTL
jgi:serine/threonine protein kinase